MTYLIKVNMWTVFIDMLVNKQTIFWAFLLSVKFSSSSPPQPQSKSNTSWSLPIDSLSRGRNILKTSLIGIQVHPQHPLSDPTTWRRCTNTSTSSTSWATTTTVGFKLKRKLSAEWLNNGKRGGAMTESECDCIVRSQSYEDEQGLNKAHLLHAYDASSSCHPSYVHLLHF